jgi:hypothetical protein
MLRSLHQLPNLTISHLCRCWALARPLSAALRSARAFLRPLSQSCLVLTPFPATLTGHRQLAENTTTLSPAVATLTTRVKHNPFVCHSYRKYPGWGYPAIANSLSSPLDLTRHSFTASPDPKGALATKPFRSNTYRKTREAVSAHNATSVRKGTTRRALFLSVVRELARVESAVSPSGGAWRRCCPALARTDRRGPSSRK